MQFLQTAQFIAIPKTSRWNRENASAKDVRLCGSFVVCGGRWHALRRGREKTELSKKLKKERKRYGTLRYHRILPLSLSLFFPCLCIFEASNRFQIFWQAVRKTQLRSIAASQHRGPMIASFFDASNISADQSSSDLSPVLIVEDIPIVSNWCRHALNENSGFSSNAFMRWMSRVKCSVLDIDVKWVPQKGSLSYHESLWNLQNPIGSLACQVQRRSSAKWPRLPEWRHVDVACSTRARIALHASDALPPAGTTLAVFKTETCKSMMDTWWTRDINTSYKHII